MSKSSLERNGWNWAAVPADVILNENLTHADVRVYAYLLWRSGKKEHSWPNVQTIADDLNMGYSTARLCLSHLVKQGWINRKRQMMRSSVTFINEIPFPRSANRLADVQLTGEPTDSYPVSRVNESHINESKRTSAAKKRRTREIDPAQKELTQYFSELTHLPIPDPKTGKDWAAAQELWFKPISRIYGLANCRGKDLVRGAVEKMRKDSLTISSVKSIENVAIAIFGENYRRYSPSHAQAEDYDPMAALNAYLSEQEK